MFPRLCVLTMMLVFVNAAEVHLRQEVLSLSEQVQQLRALHLTDNTRLKREIEDLKSTTSSQQMSNLERNERVTLEWSRTSMEEIRLELKELWDTVKSSELLAQLTYIRNQLKQVLMESAELTQVTKTQETRLDKMDHEIKRLHYEGQQTRTSIAELRGQIGKLSKEINNKTLDEFNMDIRNAIDETDMEVNHHRIRHNKMVHHQISRLAKSQEQLDFQQQNLQTQVLDVQRRLDRYEEPNWNLITAKIDFLELEAKVLKKEVQNATQKVSDLDKVHASMLELREDVESMENKADKTIPEFRKEISKLDISVAQLHAQTSYIKEDQENLRQSVKAIAVSVSNAVDRAETDRETLAKLDQCILDLQTNSKMHFSRLNDHILKTEANNGFNETETIPLPELMGEVKELQPVEREYEDLVKQLPKDCTNITGPPGTYLIRPDAVPVDTWCVNGSTLIQRRFNGSVDFNRKFAEYVLGFGDASTEFWLGLENMHHITSSNCSSMRIDMIDIYGGYWYAQYEHFSVGNADNGYVLDVAGFKGNASDAFEYQNHMEFSAIDRDRDISNTHCAGIYEGGWWYSHCQHVNINGKYNLGLTWFDSCRNEWIAVATSEMRLYRKKGCS